MNDKEIDNKLTSIISAHKKYFTGSSDYLSGVNDGMYHIGITLMKYYENDRKTPFQSFEEITSE